MSSRPKLRSKDGVHTPMQRSGSMLEVLPPEAVQTSYSEFSPHRTHSAGSDGRRSHTPEGSGPKTPPFQKRSGEGRLTPNQGSPIVRKQIVLPTVKRDYERHGTRKDEVQVMTTGDVTDHLNSSIDKYDGGVQGAVSGGQRSKADAEMDALINKLKMNASSRATESKTQNEDDCLKACPPIESNSTEDTYYLSHTPSIQPSEESIPSSTNSECSIHVAPSGASGDEMESSSSSGDGEDEDGEEGLKAPFELIGEFVESVMDEDYETAEKLCKMILMYEPENKECKEFQPLIEKMLKREREEQLWGSDDDSVEDSSDDSDEDSDDDDEGSSDEEAESPSEGSSDESSSEGAQDVGQR